MTEAEYAEQLARLGEKIHFHDGVWWLSPRLGYSRPAWRTKQLNNPQTKPKLSHAFLGYGYCTTSEFGNQTSYKVMHRPIGRLDEFSIDLFSANRRSKIRRGLKRLEILTAVDPEPYLNQMVEIVKSARKRTGAGRPIEYYEKNHELWKHTIRSIATMKDNFFFVALKNNEAIAYYHCVLVDKTMSVTAAKSHSHFLKDYPNDALIFTAMEFAHRQNCCTDLFFGDFSISDEKLNQFKFGYGFECQEIPQFQKLNPLLKLIKR